jgi:hypothetical protein
MLVPLYHGNTHTLTLVPLYHGNTYTLTLVPPVPWQHTLQSESYIITEVIRFDWKIPDNPRMMSLDLMIGKQIKKTTYDKSKTTAGVNGPPNPTRDRSQSAY